MQLKVLEAYTRDVGRGVARIDYDAMDELRVTTGDAMIIKGNKTTVCKCLPLYPSDEGKNIIRIDALVRNNCGTDMGNQVEVTKIEGKMCEQMTIAPLPEESYPPIDHRYISDALEDVYIMKGDQIAVPYFGGRLMYKIVDTKPDGIVKVSQKTITKLEEGSKKVTRRFTTIRRPDVIQVGDNTEPKLPMKEFRFGEIVVRLPEQNIKEEWVRVKIALDALIV